MMLGEASFKNSTGGSVEIFRKLAGEPAGEMTALRPGGTSASLTGTLLTIDVIREKVRYTYDLTRWQPAGALVKDESPYQLKQVMDSDPGRTLVLFIQDDSGDKVGEFRPAG
jgi:hypothetical protein